MTDPVERLGRQMKPLLRSLETLQLIGRYLNPPELASLLESVGTPEAELQAIRAAAEPWPAQYEMFGAKMDVASDFVLKAFEGLRLGATDPGALNELFRAMRNIPKALEALYPLAGFVPPVNRFFLNDAGRKNEALQKDFLDARGDDRSGVIQFGEDPDARQTVWAYVPEARASSGPAPLVVALHGGSGRGRAFLWSWIREARSRGVIVAAPTSVGQTWAIQGEDADSPNLAAIVQFVRRKWNVDPTRIMLTGMSDGGTFSYVSGLEGGSPFTHLAPVAAAFHPMLVHMADRDRLKGLPIHIIHGAQDWMFPVTMAREAEQFLKAAGAAVAYREVADLSHTYPGDMNGVMLDWLMGAAR